MSSKTYERDHIRTLEYKCKNRRFLSKAPCFVTAPYDITW